MRKWQPKTLWPRCPECGLLARGPKCTSKDQCTKTMISFEVKSPPKEDKRPPLPEKAEQRITELEALLKEIHEYDYQHLIKHRESALTADLSSKIIKVLTRKE